MTDALTPNVTLAYEVLDKIDANPELHNQRVWFLPLADGCGTAACFAGWTCLLAGDAVVDECACGDDRCLIRYRVRTSDGELMPVDARAQELLGLDVFQAADLFDGVNSREHLGELVHAWFGPRPEAAPEASA